MNEEIQFQPVRWGPLVVQTKIEDNFVDELLERGLESRHSGKKQLDARRYLAGHIENEFLYENTIEWFDPKIEPYINGSINLADQWTGVNSFKHLIRDSTVENIVIGGHDQKIPTDIGWHMSMAWINFQKKGEYNPPHNHPCDLSFVAFLQVPKEIGLEFESIPEVEHGKGPGLLYFDYGEQLPFSVKTFGKYPEKGDLFLFPGWLMHHVHDFKSDVERISESGNVMFKVVAKQPDK